MQAHLADMYPDSAATLTSLWRRYQLEYTWRATCQGTYEPFEVITEKALLHAIGECSEQIDQKTIDDLMRQYETLNMYLLHGPCQLTVSFHDVEKTLLKLHADKRYELVLFTNGSKLILDQALKTHRVLRDLFPPEKCLSVDAVHKYKPSPEAYAYLLSAVNKTARPNDVILISCNPFDICGARNLNMGALWVNRSGQPWIDRLGHGPTIVVESFTELCKIEG
jgi:2-haloacid dehalogenase